MSNKRERAKNFTEENHSVLLTIISKFSHIVESKKTDGATIKEKNQAWENIANDFNANCSDSCSRSAAQLKMLYNNLKRKTRGDLAEKHKSEYLSEAEKFKKKASQDKKELFKTGGGTYVPQLTPTGERVLALISKQVEPLNNEHDDYFSNLYDPSESIPEEQNMLDPTPEPDDNHVLDPEPPLPGTSTVTPAVVKKVQKKNKKKINLSTSDIKNQYFLNKLKCSRLELLYRRKKLKYLNEKAKINNIQL